MALSLEDQAALQHEKEMLDIYTRRRRHLEKQEAALGLQADWNLRAQIDDLTAHIERHKVEIARLETLNVEGETPLNEVEYSYILAQIWDTPEGHPTVVGNMRKEFERLRLHISEKRSRAIEWRIRGRLFVERQATIPVTPDQKAAMIALREKLTHPTEYERDHGLEHRVIHPFIMYFNLNPVLALTYVMLLMSNHPGPEIITSVHPYNERWWSMIESRVSPFERADVMSMAKDLLGDLTS